MDVGIRELKAHLSEYLGKVREGETIVITDRGTPIARIERIEYEHLPPRLQQLIREGRAKWGGGPRFVPTPIKMAPGDLTAVDYVREQRR